MKHNCYFLQDNEIKRPNCENHRYHCPLTCWYLDEDSKAVIFNNDIYVGIEDLNYNIILIEVCNRGMYI